MRTFRSSRNSWALGSVVALCGLATCQNATGIHNCSAQLEPTKVPFCEIVEHPDKYNGTIVNTSALIRGNPHGNLLHDSACQSTSDKPLSADADFTKEKESSKKSDRLKKILAKNRAARISYMGCFLGSSADYVSTDARFHFHIMELLSVDKVK